jgi:hypothetical protein
MEFLPGIFMSYQFHSLCNHRHNFPKQTIEHFIQGISLLKTPYQKQKNQINRMGAVFNPLLDLRLLNIYSALCNPRVSSGVAFICFSLSLSLTLSGSFRRWRSRTQNWRNTRSSCGSQRRRRPPGRPPSMPSSRNSPARGPLPLPLLPPRPRHAWPT